MDPICDLLVSNGIYIFQVLCGERVPMPRGALGGEWGTRGAGASPWTAPLGPSPTHHLEEGAGQGQVYEAPILQHLTIKFHSLVLSLH